MNYDGIPSTRSTTPREFIQHSLKNNLDSTCVLIGLQVCFYSAINHENDVSDTIGCLHVVRMYRFMKEMKV